MEVFTRPAAVGEHTVPATLDEMTIGQMLSLQQCEGDDVIYKACEYILDMSPHDVDDARAVDVVRFFGWVWGELQRIQKMFDALNEQPTDIEQRAGIEQLRFGVFAIADWYALRMGITDHEEALKTQWGRVYKCLEIDTKKQRYNLRLQELQNEEYKRKTRSYSGGRR